MRIPGHRTLIHIAALTACASLATAVQAQDAPPAPAAAASEPAQANVLSTVVVSGSRISARGFTQPTPTTRMVAADLEKVAKPNLFNAIAEPRRREIVSLLANGKACSVGEIVDTLNLAQPAVSKHLAVLRAVGVVSVRKAGKSRLYALNPSELKPMHDWVKQFERLWSGQLDRIKERAERIVADRSKRN